MHAAVDRPTGAFLARVSHEMRTPLAAMLGFAELLGDGEITAEQREAVDLLHKAGRHLLALVDDVLDVSRLVTGDLPISLQPVELGSVVTDAVDLVRPLAAARGIRLVGPGAGGRAGYAVADPQRLLQVLLNLLSNGIKYNRPGGRVTVRCTRPEAGRVRVTVTDTGPGIPATKLDRLFLPFERLGAEHGAVAGVGIGLALARQLTTAMGGALDVVTAVGRGSSFWVELPDWADQPVRARPGQASPVA